MLDIPHDKRFHVKVFTVYSVESIMNFIRSLNLLIREFHGHLRAQEEQFCSEFSNQSGKRKKIRKWVTHCVGQYNTNYR